MQRYFIKDTQKHEEHITVTNENDIHHIRHVMRMLPGTEIICIDQSGNVYLCRITNIANKEVHASIVKMIDDDRELPVEVAIFQGLPKKNKLEMIIQKGTELGCATFELFHAERSIVKWDEKKTAQRQIRLQKIAQEASEQSGRNYVPTITSHHSLNETLMENKDYYDLMLFAYEEEAKSTSYTSIAKVLQSCNRGMRIGVFIGPEGGFSLKEVDLFEQQGARPVRLGPRILRTETASMYALACMSYYFEEMRCP